MIDTPGFETGTELIEQRQDHSPPVVRGDRKPYKSLHTNQAADFRDWYGALRDMRTGEARQPAPCDYRAARGGSWFTSRSTRT